jgi:uncharacterized protein YbjT (DUF2867 family)
MLLLTGATGAAGSFIANEFLRHGVPVRLLVRDRAKAREFERIPTIEMVEGDMAQASTLRAALKGVERVLMISGPAPDMVETQRAFIDACKATGVRHVIKFSGLDARPDTTFAFGRMHQAIEAHLEASGLAWTHLRPTGFMQVYLREAPSIIHQGALFLPLGDTKLNPVDLADVGKIGFALLRDGGHEGKVLPVTGPEALTTGQIAAHISRAINKPVRYVSVSRTERRDALIAHGVPAAFADALDNQVAERLKGGLESEVNLTAHRLFNVTPSTFAEFAKRHAGDFGAAPAASTVNHRAAASEPEATSSGSFAS